MTNSDHTNDSDKVLCECRNDECGLMETMEPESECPNCGGVMEPVDGIETNEEPPE